MTLNEQQEIFTSNTGRLILFAFENGFALTFGEAFRTIEQQKIYFDNGKSKTMNSRHLQRLAVDFNIFKDGVLINDPKIIQPLGNYWVGLNKDNVWGGNWDRDNDLLDETFKDPYHFECKYI